MWIKYLRIFSARFMPLQVDVNSIQTVKAGLLVLQSDKMNVIIAYYFLQKSSIKNSVLHERY